jgi:transcriptional regulator with XRE-family HTH domain
MTFADKLWALRGGAGLTEAALAEKSGVPLGTIRFYAMSRRLPTLAAAVALANALGVSCAAFAQCDDIVAVYGGGDETPPRQPQQPARPRKRGGS